MIEYQKLFRQVLEEGKFKSDRTGTGTEMSNSIPVNGRGFFSRGLTGKKHLLRPISYYLLSGI
jgi:thymidylate synthase